MKARYHVMVSTGLSLGVLALSQSWPATTACFFSGILIDLDHYWEYYIIKQKFPFRYKDLVDFCQNDKYSKLYLIFHSYEYLILLWFAIYFLHLNEVWIGFALGLTVHLLFDQLVNPVKPLFYFLTFRMYYQFEKSKIVSKDYFQRKIPM